MFEQITRADLSLTVNSILGGRLPDLFRESAVSVAAQPVTVDPDAVTVLTAVVLGWPVLNAHATAQIGRFVRVEYTPVGRLDPDIVLTFSPGPEADHFHDCMRVFQKERRRTSLDPGEWFELHGKPALRLLAGALWLLEPCRGEVDFVLRWAAVTVCNYRMIYDG